MQKSKPFDKAAPNTMDTTLKTHHRLLLTGAAGGLGTALRERLKGNCAVLRLSDKAGLGAITT